MAAAALVLSLACPAVAAAPQNPRIVWRPVPFGAKRITETVAYEQRHYGLRQSTLVGPHVLVEHYTGNESFVATWATWLPTHPTRSSARSRGPAPSSSSTGTAQSTS